MQFYRTSAFCFSLREVLTIGGLSLTLLAYSAQTPETPPDETARETNTDVLSLRLAETIAAADYKTLSDDIIERVTLSLADNAATLAHTSCKTSHHPFLDRLVAKGGTAEAILPGGSAELPMDEAAAYIAYLIHAAETDDTDHRASLRASPVVIAPALALGDAVEASGEELITAIAIGYSVLGALGEPTGPIQTEGLMSASVYGTIASAAVAAYLLDLTPEQTQNAIALAATASNGLFQYYFDQTEEKRIIIARSARIGVEAALLAQAGEEAAPAILEGRSGLYPVLTRHDLTRAEADRIVSKVAALDGPLHIEPKFYTTSDSIIPYLKGLDALADKRYGAVLEDKIVNYHAPSTALGAKLNFNFVIALYLVEGSVEPQHYNASGLADEDVLNLASKGVFQAQGGEGFPNLTLFLKNGESLDVTPIFPERSEQVPAFREERMKKIEQLTAGLWSEEERLEALRDIEALPEESLATDWIKRYQARFCGPGRQ
jgi:2-methylcitrate dehydratase PrpD